MDHEQPAGRRGSDGESKKKLRWSEDVIDHVKKPEKPAASHRDTSNDKWQPTPQKLPPKCSFCRQQPAAVLIALKKKDKMKSASTKAERQRPLCLLHYYTTAAVHVNASRVTILNARLVEDQMKGQPAKLPNNSSAINGLEHERMGAQELFADAFDQLQQEIAQASLSVTAAPRTTNGGTKERTHQYQKRPPPAHDPLSILHDLGRTKKKRTAPPLESTTINYGGGFIRRVSLPPRLLQTHHQQAQVQAAQMERMVRAAASGGGGGALTTDTKLLKRGPDMSKRRPSNRKSIWNTVLDTKNAATTNKTNNGNKKKKPTQSQDEQEQAKRLSHYIIHNTLDPAAAGTQCSCGSTNVSHSGNITSRNQDVRKGEIWGNKSEDVMLRFQCNKCGKVWNEEG